MNGAQLIIQALEAQGVDTAFGYPGGCIMPLYDALIGSSIQHVLCRHEQGAALAADGYARASGEVGVCIATSGPGATNLVTGVANAYMDSIPLLVITGQVPRALIGTDAFQESDILGMTLGIVKHSYLVNDATELPAIMDEALSLATSGRPGPVWIDIPKDVLLQHPERLLPYQIRFDREEVAVSSQRHIDYAIKLIKSAKKPLIYSGGGVVAANAIEAFRALAKAVDIPQVVTLKGIGNPGKNQPLNLGMLGMHGSRTANEAVAECDVLIAVGARFDDRATGNPNEFASNAKIIQLDIDAAEINKTKVVDCYLHGNLVKNLQQLTRCFIEREGGATGFNFKADINAWRQWNLTAKAARGFHCPSLPDNDDVIQGPEFLSALSQAITDHGVLKKNDAPTNSGSNHHAVHDASKTIITCDVGQHQMWVAQYMDFDHPRQHLSSGGLGTMGFGLPAAIGASFAEPQAAVINVTGDGSFMMNLQELATIKRFNLPVKIIILNNQRLGMVRQQQELFYEGRYSEVDLSDNPDFTALAKAFGIRAHHITATHQIHDAINELITASSSVLLQVDIATEANVWPIVKPGAGNHEMIEAHTSVKPKLLAGVVANG